MTTRIASLARRVLRRANPSALIAVGYQQARFMLSRSKGRLILRRSLVSAKSDRHRVLMYCPEAFVEPHLRAMQTIGRVLADLGHEVLFPRCGGLFKRCVGKDSVGLRGDAPDAAGAEICASCIASSFRLTAYGGLPSFDLRNVVGDDVLLKAEETLASLADAELTEYTVDSFKLGKLCLHDLILSRKLFRETPLDPEQRLYLRQYLTTALATYLGVESFLRKAQVTDVVFYGQYAANIAAVCAAKKTGVNWRVIAYINHLGVDQRRIYMNGVHTHSWTARMIDEWPQWRDLPLALNEIRETGGDVLIRFGAGSFTTYSPPKTTQADVISKLDLDPSKQLIVAFTSSLDEYSAEEIIDDVLGFASPQLVRPYIDQIAWLTSMLHEIGARPDLQLVIRIHPREDANKREGARSQHLEQLIKHLSAVPSNVRVVWPADPISSYDLIEVADLVQVWSSTIGLESARLGIPVIKLFRGYSSYPEGEFVKSVTSTDALIDEVLEGLKLERSFDFLLMAWRYYGYSRFASSMDFSDVVSDRVLDRASALSPAAPGQRDCSRHISKYSRMADQCPFASIPRVEAVR